MLPKNKLFYASLINAIANKNKTVCSYLVNEYWLILEEIAQLKKQEKIMNKNTCYYSRSSGSKGVR